MADALASQIGGDGVSSLVQNPGNIKTNTMRHSQVFVPFMLGPFLYATRSVTYAAIWSAFASDLKIGDEGEYVLPWGRIHPGPRDDLLRAMKGKEEGSTRDAAAFVQYCENQTAAFL